MANKAARKTPIPLRLVEGTAEAIPIEDHDVDAVVTTWTMCSIAEIQTALQEVRRVLRPASRLVAYRNGLQASERATQNTDLAWVLKMGLLCSGPGPASLESENVLIVTAESRRHAERCRCRRLQRKEPPAVAGRSASTRSASIRLANTHSPS
jgi:SAM-dependent methyltransferase